jgi:hypothetical protein
VRNPTFLTTRTKQKKKYQLLSHYWYFTKHAQVIPTSEFPPESDFMAATPTACPWIRPTSRSEPPESSIPVKKLLGILKTADPCVPSNLIADDERSPSTISLLSIMSCLVTPHCMRRRSILTKSRLEKMHSEASLLKFVNTSGEQDLPFKSHRHAAAMVA